MAGMLFVFGKRAKDIFWRPIKYESGSPTLVCSHSGCWTQPSVPDSVSLGRATATRGDGRPRARGPGGGCPLIPTPKPPSPPPARDLKRARLKVGTMRSNRTTDATKGANRQGRRPAHAQKRTSASGFCAAHSVRGGASRAGK